MQCHTALAQLRGQQMAQLSWVHKHQADMHADMAACTAQQDMHAASLPARSPTRIICGKTVLSVESALQEEQPAKVPSQHELPATLSLIRPWTQVSVQPGASGNGAAARVQARTLGW